MLGKSGSPFSIRSIFAAIAKGGAARSGLEVRGRKCELAATVAAKSLSVLAAAFNSGHVVVKGDAPLAIFLVGSFNSVLLE